MAAPNHVPHGLSIRRTAVIVALLLLFGRLSLGGELKVRSNFSGGSGEVISIDQIRRHISIRPTPRAGKGWECWWHVIVSGLTPGETFQLEVGPAPWATPNQAAISTNGRIWKQTSIGLRKGKRITYSIPVQATEMHLAWGPAFNIEDGKQLVDFAAQQDHVSAFVLCKTRDGRPVHALHFEPTAPVKPKDRIGIWIQARQHAWEAGSSWVCEGVVDWLLDDSSDAKELRKRAEIYVVPIMDVDSVAIGAGGKNQKPQDHNRDWSDKPHWPAVRAAQAKIKEMNKAGVFHLFIDLHNPGASSRFPYFYVPPPDTQPLVSQRNQQAFLQSVRINMSDPLPFKGTTQPSGAGYDANWKRISKNWVAANTREGVVSVTLETAWNTPHSTQVGYQAVGSQLAASIADYVELQLSDGAISVEAPR